MKGFSFYYIEANLVCVIIFILLLVHNFTNIDRQEKQIKFDRALIAFILYFLTDCVWAAIVDGVIPRAGFGAVTFLLYVFMATTIYAWLDYVMAYEQIPNRDKPGHRRLMALPVLLSAVALLLNFIIAPDMLVDYEALETRSGFSLYLLTVPSIYLVAILFYALGRARSVENPAEKRNHLLIGLLPLLTSVGGLAQEFFLPHAPIYCFIVLFLMLAFYIQSLEFRISLDPLTGLNNRGQLERYCAQRGNLFMDGRMTVVVMMDIDKFKAINDTYGHAEGDKALVVVAGALKRAVNSRSMPTFLCRYGGDEFTLIVHPGPGEDVDALIREVQDEIARSVDGLVYPITVSAGFDALQDERDSIRSCIQRADRKLYMDKGSKK